MSAPNRRFGIDFWDVQKADSRNRDASTSISARFPESDQAQLNIHNSMRFVLAPGPAGAVPTARYENLREGLQEAQARVFLERAIAGGKLGADPAKRARAVLDERTHLMRAGMLSGRWNEVADALAATLPRLYAAAAEAAAAAGAGGS